MKQSILVVEDNQLSRELLCDWLETEGYEVTFAENLKTAFAQVEAHPPDAVLLDVQLGADDGLSLASWIRQQPMLRHIPVIAVTAHAMMTEQQRILQAGRLRAEEFDAVFLDIRMPPPDGIELARLMRASKLNRTTPIVMITGEQERGVMTRAFRAGATFFLSKPVDRTRLLRLIRVTRGSIQHERRRFRRVKVSCKVSIESKQDRFEGTTLDLSLKAMLVLAHHVLPLGSLVQVNLELSPATPPVRVAARRR